MKRCRRFTVLIAAAAILWTPRNALAQGSCLPASLNSLCLNGARFRVEVNWQNPSGQSGLGQAVQLTPDSGYFWFFDPGNVEMVVKVLNACSINNRHWVFASGLTNVRVEMRVTDTATGVMKMYTNPQGMPFQPILDTAAFATCP